MSSDGTTAAFGEGQFGGGGIFRKFGEKRITDAIKRLVAAIASSRIFCAATDARRAVIISFKNFQMCEGASLGAGFLEFAWVQKDVDHLLEVAAFKGTAFVRAERNRSGRGSGSLAHAIDEGTRLFAHTCSGRQELFFTWGKAERPGPA
jgi:hypothetical protein